jgi:hypothetical protein
VLLSAFVHRVIAINLNSPATAFWLDPQRDRKSFDSLREAIQFVMEVLEERFRWTAFIQTDGGHYDLEAIQEIYDGDEY